MSSFSNLVETINDPYLRNEDGSIKLDSRGRKRHIRQVHNRYKEFYIMYGIRLETEMNDALDAKAKKTGKKKAELIRTYIEWGLENDE